MADEIRIRLKDYYENPVGNEEYLYVSREVYEILADIFRKEAHAQEMKDIRHIIRKGYAEDDMLKYIDEEQESVEDMVIRKLELERLENAMIKATKTLTPIQRIRLKLYFYDGLSVREIAQIQNVNINAVWKSLQMIIDRIKDFFEKN